MLWIKRFLPAGILVLAVVVVLASGLTDYLTFDQLKGHRSQLLDFVNRHALLAPLLFMAIYAVVIALSIPGGAVLTLTGGFLFGIALATLYVVVAATLGASLVFLAAKTALGDSLRAKTGPWLRRMEAGFRASALNYLLFLRLIPLFPFWLVNLVPAFLGVPFSTFVIATFLGIIPGTLVYASVGNGLGAVFEAGQSPDLGIIFRPAILLPMIGLAVLAVLPVAYRKIKGGPPI